jgi:hypothetical protein
MITLPRSVADLEEAKRLAPAIGVMEYGQGSYLSSIENNGDEISLSLGVKVKLFIEDEDRAIPVLRSIPDVTKITFKKNKTGRFSYEYEDYSTFALRLKEKDYLVLQSLERELIKNTYRSLARIPNVANTMTPLMEISNSFRFHEKLSMHHILKSRKNENQMKNYITFMVRNGLIEIMDNEIYPTRKLMGYIDSREENLSVPLMGDLLMKSYTDLMTFLHLSGLKPYLTIANAYYTPSSEARSLLRLGLSRLQGYYRKLYRSTPVLMKLQNQVSMLSDVNILSIEKRTIIGKENILEKQMSVLDSFTRG